MKSVEWKIRKRVLESIGHVMEMENGSVTKRQCLYGLK